MALPLLVAGTVGNAYSSYQGGKVASANQMAQAQAESARSEAEARNLEAKSESDLLNALFAEQDADDAINRANFEATLQRRSARQLLSAQRAALAESGILSSPTADNVMLQSAIDAETDNLLIRYAGSRQAYGLLFEASQYRDQADMAKQNASTTRKLGYMNTAIMQRNASDARKAGNLGAVTSLITGTSQIMNYRMNQRNHANNTSI